LQVIIPQHVESGKAFDAVVRALDAQNKVVPGFRGTVHFSLTTADAGATLPVDYKFTAKDAGRHTFQITLSAVGPQTVNVATSSISGKANVIVDAPVTHFGITTYGKPVAGTPTIINVVALDANNRPVPGYTGTVHFTSTDFYASLPDNYKFTAADGGSRLFQVTFAATGKPTLAVTDVANGSLTGGIVVKVASPFRYSPYAMLSPSWYGPFYNNYYLSPWF
jgi:hypothetical protein